MKPNLFEKLEGNAFLNYVFYLHVTKLLNTIKNSPFQKLASTAILYYGFYIHVTSLLTA